MNTPDNILFEVVENDSNPFAQPDTNISVVAPDINEIPLDQQIRNYVNKNKPKLCILTPCYGGMCMVNYIHCIMTTVELFRQFQFPIQIEFCKNDSLVTRARNNLVARAMSDPTNTHIMFIDSDITWSPIDILKLVLADKPIVGGIYPLKHYDWSKLVTDQKNPYNSNVVQSWISKKNNSQLKDVVNDANVVQHNLLKYNLNFAGAYLTIEKNLAQVKHLATGFMMIQRNTFDKMMSAFPSTKYVDDVNFLQPPENKYAYALFDCGVEDGHYLSEDWMFCHRWTKMGGAIWIDVSINLTHTGMEDYKGSFVTSLI
jgi:hypothetical protein